MGHGQAQLDDKENTKRSQRIAITPHPLHLASLPQTLLRLATTFDVLAMAERQPAYPMPEMLLSDKAALVREDLPGEWYTHAALPPAALLCLECP